MAWVFLFYKFHLLEEGTKKNSFYSTHTHVRERWKREKGTKHNNNGSEFLFFSA